LTTFYCAILRLGSLALLTDKQHLPRVEFTKLVQSFGWSKGVLGKYLKIAIAFQDIDASKLVQIEPYTLFKITSNKRFVTVVEAVKKSIGHVTQQLVENLINTLIPPRASLPDEPTIWRAEKDGSRSCVLPPIKEDDQYTGMAIQRAMDVEGISAQSFVREAAAFREAWLCGAFLLVGELPPHLEAILGEKLEYNPPTPADDIEVQTYTEQSEADETTVEVVEAMEIEVVEIVQPIELPPIELAMRQDIETSTEGNEDLLLNDSILTMSFEKVARLVMECTTWSEIVAITSKLDKEVKLKSWNVLSESERRRIIMMKEAVEPSIKVGDKVNWTNHYPYLSAWLPLEVQEINNGQVKLELCDFLVPIEELSLAS
jgi:hypothetical protein